MSARAGREARVPVISSLISSRFFSKSPYRMGWAVLSGPDFGRLVPREVLFTPQPSARASRPSLPLQIQHSPAPPMGGLPPAEGDSRDCQPSLQDDRLFILFKK